MTLTAQGAAERSTDALDLPAPGIEHGGLGMAEIDAEGDARRHGVRRVGLDLEPADGEADPVVRVVHQLLEGGDHPDRGPERVFAAAKGCGAGMGRLALDHDLVPARPLDAGDDAHLQAARLEPRPLLDVRLEIAGDLEAEGPARHLGRRGQRLGERGAEADAGRIEETEAVLERQLAREHGRAHRARREPPALLVGPRDHLDRVRRRDPGIVERFQRLEACEHPEDAIEAAAGRLAVHVRAGEHRRSPRPRPGRRMKRFAISSTAGS